jgi:hypothetical protein
MIGIKASNAFLVFVIFISHFFAPTGYVFYEHTMSEMAAQFAPNAWILTTGFAGAGVGYIMFSYLAWIKKSIPTWLYGLVIANGITLILLAFFPTSYDGYSIPANETVVIIHRYIAYASNLVTMLSLGFHAYFSKGQTRWIHLVFVVLTIIFSAFFIGYNQDVRGLFQRLILLTTSSWTWFYFGTMNRLTETQAQSLVRS